MNHTYRVVWNVNLGSWQVASEFTRSHTKGATAERRGIVRRIVTAGVALTAVSLTLVSPLAYADNLLIGAGGTGGGNGGNGGINGGNGGPAFYLPGGGGGGISGTAQIVGSPSDSSSVGTAYDNVVIGGGGGGGSGFGGINGGTGGAGEFNVNGAFNVSNSLIIGGAGGGGGAGNSFSDRGGNGGTGGSGTLTATGAAAITVGGQVIIGGLGGGGGVCGCSGNGGSGGAGGFNLGDGSSLNLSGVTFTINGNGTLNIGNAVANGATAGVITGLAGSIVNNGIISFNQSNTSYTFNTAISGSGTVTQAGNGTTILTGVNSYSGGTAINAGLINFNEGSNLGTGNVTLNGGGLQWAAGNSTDISGRLNALGINGGTFDTNGNNVTLASSISGAGGLTKAGSGVLTLTGANVYQGATTITGGTLALSGAASIASSSGVTDNGVFDISDTTSGASIKTVSGAGIVALGTQTLTLTDASGTFGGAITGAGAVVKQGSGTLALSGVNTYTGNTTISGGTLALSGAGSIAASSGVVDNGTFDIAGTTSGAAIKTVSGTGIVALGTQTLTLTDASGTFGGAITGAGAVDKQGAGTLALSGANTYTGNTTISSGALALSGAGSIAASSEVVDNGTFDIAGTTSGAAIKTVSGAGIVALGTKTLTLTDASGTFGGTIAGAGAVDKQGSGTLALSGVSTYTGNTTISGGTLALSGAGSIAASSEVVDDGTFDIAGTTSGAAIKTVSGTGIVALGTKTLTLTDTSGTFGGAITGAGAVVKQGSGTLALSGVNTYTGNTTISGGTLALSGAGSIAASSEVVDDGTFDIAGTTSGASIKTVSGAGVVALGTKTLTLTDASGTFNGMLTGTGSFVKRGSGLLVLNGNSAAFAGTTSVSGGSLEVGDIDTPTATLGGNVNVDSAGRLGGHGTISGSVTNGGAVAPGGSIGTLSIGGNYVQSSTATLAIEISPTVASQLKVDGIATLNGVLAISYDPGTYTARSYTLVSAAKGVSGAFSTITSEGASNLGALAPSVGYSANGVELTLSEQASDPATPPSLVVAPINTSIYAAVGTSAILGAHAQGAALLDHLDQASNTASTTPYGWVTMTGTHTRVGGTSGEPGFQSNRYGFLAGLERNFATYATGIAVGYDHADIAESETGDSGTTDTLRAALYGSRRVGPVNLGGTLGVGLDFLSQKRPFGAIGTAEGDHIGQEFNAGGEANLPMTFDDVKVIPRIGMRYAYFHANGFSESGAGGQNLNVGSDNVRSLQPYVGLSIESAFGDALKPVNAALRISYAHELLDANRALSVASQDGTVFVAPGTSLPRGYLSAGASVTLHPRKNMDVSVGFDTIVNTTHVSAEQGSLHVGYRF